MLSRYFFVFTLLLCYDYVHISLGAVHEQLDNTIDSERESDGSFKAIDAAHYEDSRHNVEFDHEAILGSVKEAEEFDKLSPEEAKKRLSAMLPKMDLDGDQHIQRNELKLWILNSFINLSKEEAKERMTEADMNEDGFVSWGEYLQESFGIDEEEGETSALISDNTDTGMLVKEEKLMWIAADFNQDGLLDAKEFAVFSNPEEHEVMHPYLINQTLREKDANKDGKIDFQEYIGDRGSQQDKEWYEGEKDKFDNELDVNKDGVLDHKELHIWLIPNNDEIAEEEVEHLFDSSDDDKDNQLSFSEIVDHHDVFVGSEATDYGDSLLGEHFDDEL